MAGCRGRDGSDRCAARTRRSGIRPTGRPAHPGAAAGGARLRAQPRDRRRSGAGDVDRAAEGHRQFEGRSSLRTWLFTVAINIAKARGIRERRGDDAEIAAFTGGTVDPARFRPAGQRWAGHWKSGEEPSPFPDTPEGSVLGRELVDVARAELDKLPRAATTGGDDARHAGLRLRVRSVSCWTSAWPTSACCCTGAERSCARRSKTIWRIDHDGRWTAPSSSSW